MTLTLFVPFFIDSLYPQVGMSVVKILERLGRGVACPDGIACWGQTKTTHLRSVQSEQRLC